MRWDDWQKFKDNRPLKKFAQDPYFFLFYALIASVVQLAHSHAYPGKSVFIFDNHGASGKKVEAWYPRFYELLNDRTRAYIALKPHFEDEKGIVPLQAADLFAWHHRKYVLGELNEWQQSKWLLLSTRINSVIVESGNLVSMAEGLAVARATMSEKESLMKECAVTQAKPADRQGCGAAREAGMEASARLNVLLPSPLLQPRY